MWFIVAADWSRLPCVLFGSSDGALGMVPCDVARAPLYGMSAALRVVVARP